MTVIASSVHCIATVLQQSRMNGQQNITTGRLGALYNNADVDGCRRSATTIDQCSHIGVFFHLLFRHAAVVENFSYIVVQMNMKNICF